MTPLFLALSLLSPPQGVRHVQVEVELAEPAVAQGASVDAIVRFRIDPGWHVYHPDDASGMGQPPSVSTASEGFAIAGGLSTAAVPLRHTEQIGPQSVTSLWLEGAPEFRVPLRADAAPGRHVVELKVGWMECNDRMCLPPTSRTFPLELEVTAAEQGAGGGAAAEPDQQLSGRVKVDWDFPERLAKGDVARLRFTLDVADGWHVYHPRQDEEWGQPTRIEIAGSGFRVKSGPTTAKEPIRKKEYFGDLEAEYLWLEGEIAFEAEIEVTGDPAAEGARVFLRWQTCNDEFCLDPEWISFPVGNAAAAGAAGTAGGGPGLGDGGFFAFLLLAIGAGLLTLLTPCVFPMIPVTISYFTKRADDGKGTPLGNASAYAGGIVFTFAGIGVGAALLLGPTGANAIGANPWVNLGIGALFVWMALSLLGFYEIQAPRFLQNFASKTQSEGRQKGGYLPVMLMAIAFSITAFTCTVGFVGAIFAAGLNLGLVYLLGGMLVYGAVFALPFFFLALFPSWLKSMPSAGGWMNVVKVSAGFVELIAAIKFFSNTDLFFDAQVLTWPVAIALTIVFLLLWAAYMFGLYRTHHDFERVKPSKGRIGVGLLALALAAFFVPGLWNRSETAYPGGWAEAYLPPFDYGAERHAADGGVIKAGGLSWQESYERAYQMAAEDGTPLFVDFTGVTCVNCRKMEYDVFPHESVTPLLAGMARAELWVDKPPFGKWNAGYQVDRFEIAAQPYYAVIDPRDDAVLGTFPGYDPDPSVFAAFLEKARAEYAARAPGAMPAGGAWHQREPVTREHGADVPRWLTQALLALLIAATAALVAALARGEVQKRRQDAEFAAA